MKIAFIVSPYSYYANRFSGVVVQAQCWRDALIAAGHEVVPVNPMDAIDWPSFDIVHLFQHGGWCDALLGDLQVIGAQTFLSPIIDPPVPYGRVANLMSRIPFEKLRLQQNQRLLRKYGQSCQRFLARSQLERQSLLAVGVPGEKIVTVPISLSKEWVIDETDLSAVPRNGAILHVSHLAQARKNVRRLVRVAIANKLTLRLAGTVGDTNFSAWLKDVEAANPQITYLGRISDDALKHEMLSCSAFCLPSLYEGVGLVALDAAYCGANLVVSRNGGTRDYLGECATYVDPYDDDALAEALAAAVAAPSPNLLAHRHVAAHLTREASGRALVAAYATVL